MKTIIATTGTSIAKGFDDAGDISFQQFVAERIKCLTQTYGDPKFLTYISAETHSFHAMKLNSDDKVILLHSDTDIGLHAAQAILQLTRKHFTSNCEIRLVKGLQVERNQQFRSQGIQNLFFELDRITSASTSEVVLNATGGFKSVVPYLTLYGMLNQLDIKYIFERSGTLITFPPAPVTVDFQKAGQLTDFLLRLNENTFLSVSEFDNAISEFPYHDRKWFKSLVDIEDNNVMLSAFGIMVLNTAEAKQSVVKMSKEAVKALEQSSGDSRKQFCFILERIANPLWRKSKIDPFSQTDMIVCKPGNTDERAVYFVKHDTVFVCLLYPNHDVYMRDLSGRSCSQFTHSTFTPYLRPPDIKHIPTTEEEMFRELKSSIKKNKKTIDKLESNIKEKNTEIRTQVDYIRDIETQYVESKDNNERLNESIRQLTSELASYRKGGLKSLWKVIRNSVTKRI